MSNVSHVSTVDRGLKMKIKRTKLGPNSTKTDVLKQEAAPKGGESSTGGSSAQHGSAGVPSVNGVPSGSTTSGITVDCKATGSAAGSSTPTKVAGSNLTPELPKDKSPKVKAHFNKKEKAKDKNGSTVTKTQGCDNPGVLANGSSASSGGVSSIGGVSISNSGCGLAGVPNGLDLYPQITLEPRVAVEAVSMKRERAVVDDPYEFNAKVEDGFVLPPKKLKTESKLETASSPVHFPSYQDASTETCTIGVNTEAEYLGPCEPGSSVTLQGIVWQEQLESGLLVINVTWRDKTYVGTLLDATKNDWAPPRPNCDSPVSDFETRTPKGRGKRGRAATGTPSSDRSIAEGRKLRKTRRGSNNFPAPASPARPDSGSALKRKARNAEESDSNKGDKGIGPSSSKRSRSCSRGGASGTESPTPPAPIECPEPNCKKKYKHINGLRYHQSHAHQQPASTADDEKEEEEEIESDCKDGKKSSEARDSRKDQQMSERAERAKAKEQRLQREKQREKSLEKDCSAIEDNIPLKAFAGKVNVQSIEKSKTETSSKSVESSTVVSTVVAPTMVNATTAMPSTTLTSTTVSSKKKDGGPSMSVSLAVSKTAGTPGQVHQIAGVGCIGVPMMASSNTVQAPVIAVPPASVASTTTAPIPITVAPLGSLDSKDSKVDKTKNKLAARPIVPAPTPIAMASTGTSSLNPSSSIHTPVSQGLKMIQPKPTIMGEYSSVNHTLADLKEKRKTKKKKDKEGVQGQAVGTSSLPKVSKDDNGRCDRPAVIKSVASPPMSRPVDSALRKDAIPSIEVSKPADSPRPSVPSSTGAGQSSSSTQQVAKNSSDQMRSVQPPGLLKVNSPLHLSSGERKTPITDDVQSPAYSDISDANDSSSPQQQESPKKDSDVTAKKDDTPSNPPQGDGASVAPSSFGGMFYYNRPSPFLSPNVNTPHASPNSSKAPPQKDPESNPSEDSNRPSNAGNEAVKSSGDNTSDSKDSASKCLTGSKPETQGPPPPPQQQQLYQQQQQQQMEWQQKLMQVYSHIRLMPLQSQYQYLAAYGMLEPYAQCILSQQDPHYRQIIERISQEQKRLHEQQGLAAKRPEPPETPTRKQHGSRPPSADRHSCTPEAGPSGVQKVPQPVYGAHGLAPDRMHEGKTMSESVDDREIREQQTLREKQNENHQILKENIELKSQMDRGRQEIDLNRQKQEENRRMMFFQQKQIEQHRSAEKRKHELHGKPPELKSSVSSGLSPMDTSRHSGIPLAAVKTEDIKKEPVDQSRMKDSARTSECKSSEDKKLGSEKGRSAHSDPSKTKSTDQAGITIPVVSSMAPSGNPAPGAPGQYGPYPYPVIPSHYGPMQVDPSHPMYRQMGPHMIGYATAGPPGAYIHPSQLGYRMGPPPPMEADKDSSKCESKSSGPAPASEDSGGKGGADGSQPHFYSPSMHKIHELAHEKARARPGSASPAPAKSGEGESRSTGISALPSGDKQRGSPPTHRHLHTHHHTHVLSHGFYPTDSPFAMFAPSPHNAAPPAPALQPPPFSK